MSTNEELKFTISIIHRMSHYIEVVMEETGKLFTLRDVDERKAIWEKINSISNILEEARKDAVHHVLVYIVRAQPLGRDLIAAYVLINITYDLYRISRYCREIAKIDQLLAPKWSLADLKLPDLFNRAVDAVKAALEDLERQNPLNIEHIKEVDNAVDSIYGEALRRALDQVSTPGIRALELLIVRHVERIVDHAHYIEQYLVELK